MNPDIICIAGGILLAMIEGIGIAMTRFSAEQFNPGRWKIKTKIGWKPIPTAIN